MFMYCKTRNVANVISNHTDPVRLHSFRKYEGVSKSFRTESITKYTLTTINTRWEATQRVMAVKLIRLTHRIAIQLRLVAESCTICSSRSRRPVRKLLDTPSYWLLRFLEVFTVRESVWNRSCITRVFHFICAGLPLFVTMSRVFEHGCSVSAKCIVYIILDWKNQNKIRLTTIYVNLNSKFNWNLFITFAVETCVQADGQKRP
jgi:hypothetical protein